MEEQKKLELLADILNVDASELTPKTRFDELEWDSVSVLSFILMIEEEFGKEIDGSVIKKFVVIQDALDVMNS